MYGLYTSVHITETVVTITKYGLLKLHFSCGPRFSDAQSVFEFRRGFVMEPVWNTDGMSGMVGPDQTTIL